MTVFSMEIAGAAARVEGLFECTPAFFRPYLTERAPDFPLRVTREDLAAEADFLRREAREEGFRPRTFTDPFLERAVIQRRFAEFLFDRDILLLHGSTVAVDGKAYLFTAKSGTGKSTHTRLWRELFGSRAVMVNDDKPFLQLADGSVLAWGSPWSGKHGLDSNICIPLAGICFLERGGENRIAPAGDELLPFLYTQSFCPPQKQAQLEALLKKLTGQVPLWHMHCTRSPEAARIAFDAMGR